jgi:hypothetical protein
LKEASICSNTLYNTLFSQVTGRKGEKLEIIRSIRAD